MDEISQPLPGGIESGAVVVILVAAIVIAVVALLAFRERLLGWPINLRAAIRHAPCYRPGEPRTIDGPRTRTP